MSEFVEIGGGILRLKDIRAAVPTLDDNTLIKFCDGGLDSFHEPYESVRDKLLGKPPKAVDLRGDFLDDMVNWLCSKGHSGLADLVVEFYRSTMLSEMEGAG